MNCLHCSTELIHGGDHDGEEEEDHDIVSNLSCPNCETFVLVYHSYLQLTNAQQEQSSQFYLCL